MSDLELVRKVCSLSLSTDPPAGTPKARVLVGHVEAVIESLSVITVKPIAESGNAVLSLGTAVYLRKSIPGLESEAGYTLLGHVEDIFGPVGDHMYSVKALTLEDAAVAPGEAVYYVNDRDTRFLNVSKLRRK